MAQRCQADIALTMAMNTFAQTIAYTLGIQKKSTKNYANKMQHTGHIGGMSDEK